MQPARDLLSDSAHSIFIAEFGQAKVRKGLCGLEIAFAGSHCFAVKETSVDWRW
jgi:hypothetical protein